MGTLLSSCRRMWPSGLFSLSTDTLVESGCPVQSDRKVACSAGVLSLLALTGTAVQGVGINQAGQPQRPNHPAAADANYYRQLASQTVAVAV